MYPIKFNIGDKLYCCESLSLYDTEKVFNIGDEVDVVSIGGDDNIPVLGIKDNYNGRPNWYPFAFSLTKGGPRLPNPWTIKHKFIGRVVRD